MNFEYRDPRFLELNRLISLGLEDVRRDGRPQQVIHCVRCGRQVLKRTEEINMDEPQYCVMCIGPAKRELNLIQGGRRGRRKTYESPELRRRIYLQETGQTVRP